MPDETRWLTLEFMRIVTALDAWILVDALSEVVVWGSLRAFSVGFMRGCWFGCLFVLQRLGLCTELLWKGLQI